MCDDLPRPNDQNILTQHIATLLAQYLQAPPKRSQHFSTTYRNIVDPVFTSPAQTIATFQHNISQHCWVQLVARAWPPCCDPLCIENQTSAHAQAQH